MHLRPGRTHQPNGFARLIHFGRADWPDPHTEMDTALAGRREAFQGAD